MLQIDLVALEGLIEVLGAPAVYHPNQVILDHGDRRVGHGFLLRGETRVDVLLELGTELLEDDGAVGYFLAVQLDEGKLTAFRTVLHFMVNVLKIRISRLLGDFFWV